ncbi:S26 family signal peptidase [Pseudomonas aeruginosa]
MRGYNFAPGRSMSPAQADSGNQLPAGVKDMVAIEGLGHTLPQVVPWCSHAGQSSVHLHAAARWKYGAMATDTRWARWPLALATGGLVALGWAMFGASSPRVVYNASDSVPAGWYHITSTGSLAAGDLVLVRLPAHAATLAAQRGYLPSHVPLLKSVAAVSPQIVCAQGDQMLVDGHVVVRRLYRDQQGRALPFWQACRRLVGDELFLLSTSNPESFDSRYFGPIRASAVIGQAQPLWRESRR